MILMPTRRRTDLFETLKMVAPGSSAALVPFSKSLHCHLPEDVKLLTLGQENVKRHKANATLNEVLCDF
jgi:hypothetical protein